MIFLLFVTIFSLNLYFRYLFIVFRGTRTKLTLTNVKNKLEAKHEYERRCSSLLSYLRTWRTIRTEFTFQSIFVRVTAIILRIERKVSLFMLVYISSNPCCKAASCSYKIIIRSTNHKGFHGIYLNNRNNFIKEGIFITIIKTICLNVLVRLHLKVTILEVVDVNLIQRNQSRQ